jgi:hypothetical protein
MELDREVLRLVVDRDIKKDEWGGLFTFLANEADKKLQA